MQVINTGTTYEIYDSSVRTFDRLPAQAYSVCFAKNSGFFLKLHDAIEIGEKVYGVHTAKVEKVLRSFSASERNLGVILSGDKGIGKSLFAKMLSIRAVENGLPLLIVNTYVPGIADYLASIKQECVVLFDEYDKTFPNTNQEGSAAPQAEMLTLFDGVAQGKKLFVVTCNELNRLNAYLVNRPGRFHYHFRFEYPSPAEIREYMQDKLDSAYYGEIDKVITFSRKTALNYDCLRSIVFELTFGIPFEEAIKDLNILNMRDETYDATVYFKDGGTARRTIDADLFGDLERHEFTTQDHYDFMVIFNPADAVYDMSRSQTIVPGENIQIDWEEDYYGNRGDEEKKKLEQRKLRQVDHMVLRRKTSKDIHYKV